jgi:Skp family chaperone for outer membrane proteins
MFRVVFLISFLMFFAVAPLSAAQAEGVAVVNVQKLLRDSVAIKSARDQLKAKQDQFLKEIKGKEGELKKEDEELAKQRSILAPEAFEQKVNAFREKAAGVQRDARMKQNQLSKALDSALGEVQKAIVSIVSDMAKEKGFTVAIPSTQALYYQPSLDITDEVLKRLNARMTKITINFQ